MPGELQVVGAELTGWRGPKAHYAVEDGNGETSALYLLASEDTLYKETLTEVNPWYDADEIVADPYVPITTSVRPVQRELVHGIESSLFREHVLPHGVLLCDPVIRLHPEGGGKPVVYPVREIGTQALRAA